MNEYIPSPTRWVAKQVDLYEGSGGNDGTTLKGLPVIIVTNIGWRTGAIRKTPLMRVVDEDKYILVASKGGSPKHPFWYRNLKANPTVEIQDRSQVRSMVVKEVTNPVEKKRLWNIAVEAYPPYQEYQEKTDRVIPVFIAETTE